MNKPLNIVYTGSFQFPEGLAGTKRVKNILQEHNCSVKVLLIANSRKNTPIGIFHGIPFFTIFRAKKSINNLLLFIPFIISGIIKLHQFFEKDRRNVFYVYSGINIENLWLILLSKLIGFRIIVDIVEDFSLNEERVSTWRSIKIRSNIFFERFLPLLSSGIIVISKYLEQKFNHPRYRELPVIEIPVSAGNLKLSGKSGHAIPGKNNILYSGTYGIKDGFEFFLKAIAKLVINDNNFHLILTGNPSDQIHAAISKYQLDNNTTFTGFLEEDQYYLLLNSCSVHCMTRIDSPYANAGFPFKLGEYMASGVPVVATKISNVADFIEDGKNGLLIDPNNVEQIVKAILRIINQPELADNLGQNGRKTAERYFNPKIQAKLIEDFLS